MTGPHDFLDIGWNNSPDPANDDDEVAVDWDELADYPLESDEQMGDDDE